MNGKQIFQVAVGVGSVAALASIGMTYKDVSYGVSELTPAGGALTGIGGVGGVIGLFYSLLTVGKSLFSGLGGDKVDPLLGGGLAILQSLMSGKQDAIGLTKHAALAILFADRLFKKDDIGVKQVQELSIRVLELDAVVQSPAKKDAA